MTELCSVCMLESPTKLTPIFTKNGNYWQSTGLSEMLEVVLEEKILEGHESMMTICTTCIYKISKLFHKDTLKLKLNTFKQTYCAILDEEEPSQRKKLKTTTDELKIISFGVQEKRDHTNYGVQEKKDHVNCIPLECMAKIFTYLSPVDILEVEKVCKQWKDASEIAWGKIKEIDFYEDIVLHDKGFSYSDQMLSDKVAKQVLPRLGRYLKKLKVNIGYFEYNVLSMINNYCQNLNKIEIEAYGIDISKWDYDYAFSRMKVLKEIRIFISNCPTNPMNFVRIISTLPSDIEKIKIAFCDSEDCQQLENFDWVLNRFYALNCLSLSGFVINEETTAALLKKETLVELDLSWCYYSSDIQLTKKLPNLEKLGYYYQNNDPFDLFLSFINCCKNLKELNLRLEDPMPEFVFNELRTLKQLEHVHVYFSSTVGNNDVIGILAESCPNLKHLELEFDSNNAAEFDFRNVVNFENLERLAIRRTKGMNDDHLSSIAMKYKKLKYLELYGCTGISNSGLQKLGNFVNLECLNIGEVEHVDDSVILSITSNCIKLKELNLHCLNNISDSALETLAQLKDLESLDILRIIKIGDNVISRIVTNCKKLRKFKYDKSRF